ncbi:immunity 49 family protein [Myxococcus xanthus]|uniref:Imm49 family immunity protein n=1 Tax=Myxococcus xanthus TaxID=34 RepID=UPI001917209D|nr:Imm49 family immunity protein [Myxococcus xanthus]QQR45135.1 immunity 49 family protein [Myxococcus xanthus]
MDALPDLAVFVDAAEHGLRNLSHPACTLPLAGRFCDEVTTWRRALGIARLLMHADTNGFHHELLRSAYTRASYLARCQREGYADFHGATSRFEPFLDALTAGDFACAKRIAELSPALFRKGDEYQEDFIYARFLFDFCLVEGRAGDALEGLLAQYEAIDGHSWTRLELCRALYSRDAARFERGIEGLLEDRAQEVAGQQRRRMDDAPSLTGQAVCIEALALLKLAESSSIPARNEYRFCPALARIPMTQPFPRDGYPGAGVPRR